MLNTVKIVTGMLVSVVVIVGIMIGLTALIPIRGTALSMIILPIGGLLSIVATFTIIYWVYRKEM